jgi:rSAM/selenodomain-associated transferase 1
MVKEPVMGRVKTRLARGAGAVLATAFYRHATGAVLGRLGCDPRWRTCLAVTPDRAANSAVWPACRRVPQGPGDLGRRMQRLAERLPPGPVVIVGTDVPGIRPHHIASAFRQARRHDVVLGPAVDGGYWLIGFRRSPRVPRCFAGVRWSTAHALADTRANLAGWDVGLLATLADVDEAGDLARAPRAGCRVARDPPPLRQWDGEADGRGADSRALQ